MKYATLRSHISKWGPLGVSAVACVVTFGVVLLGESMVLDRVRPERDVRAARFYENYDSLSRVAGGQEVELHRLERSGPALRVAMQPQHLAETLASLADRIDLLEVRLRLEPRLLTRRDLTSLERPTLLDILHSARYYRDSVLDTNLDLALRIEAFSGLGSLPVPAAHMGAEVRDAWLRDAHLATTEAERESMVYAVRHERLGDEVESKLRDFLRNDPSPRVRTGALAGLEHSLADERVRDLMTAAAHSDPSLRVRRNAKQALARWDDRNTPR